MQIGAPRLLPCLCLLVLLAGCEGRSFDFTTESGARWFAENRRDVLWLNRQLLARPEIAWVEGGMNVEYVPKLADFTEEIKAVYRKVEARAEALEIINIAVSREGNQIDGALISVRYLLKRTGLVFSSGAALTIEYIPDERFLQVRREWPGTQVAPLDVKDWYVIVARFE